MLPEDLNLCSRLSKLNRLSADLFFEIADGTLPVDKAARLADELTDLSNEFARRAHRHVILGEPTVIDSGDLDP